MTHTNNRLLDEFAKLMTDAAGVAQGVQREVETVVRTQAERFLAELDIVQREEFEAVKELASKARSENADLKARIDELEALVAKLSEAPAKRSRSKPAAKSKPDAT